MFLVDKVTIRAKSCWTASLSIALPIYSRPEQNTFKILGGGGTI